MIRSQMSGTGFALKPAHVASSGLIHAVAASLAVAGLSLCAIVALTVLSSGIVAAMAVAN